MKYIKSYKIFESTYTIEEYTGQLVGELGKYNMSSIEIRDLIQKLESDINDAIENGIHPLQFTREIIKDLELDDRGKNGWNSFLMNNTKPSTIKYL
jgi:hypothetical protein